MTFNCDTCEVAQRSSALDDENVRAWDVYHHIANRFVIETRTGSAVFQRLTDGLSTEACVELVGRLNVLWEIFQPRKREQKRGPHA